MNRFYIILLFSLCLNSSYGQQIEKEERIFKLLDSLYSDSVRLVQILEQREQRPVLDKDSLIYLWKDSNLHDTVRLNAVIVVIEGLSDETDKESITLLIDSMYYFARDRKLKYYEAAALQLNGNMLEARFLFKAAFEYYDRSVEILENLDHKVKLSEALHQRANVQWNLGKYSGALEDWNTCLSISKETNDQYILFQSFNGLGLVYEDQGEYLKAIDYYFQAIENANYRRPGLAHTALFNAGVAQMKLGNYEKSMDYYKRSLRIYDLLKISPVVINTFMAELYLGQNELIQALALSNANLKLLDDLKFKSLNLKYIAKIYKSQGDSLLNIGQFQKSNVKYDSAILCGKQALDLVQQLGLKNEISDISNLLYETYQITKQPKHAMVFLKLYAQTRDSMLSDGISKRIALHQFELQSKHKQDSLEMVRLNEKFTFEADIQRRQSIQLATIGMLILLLILLYISYRYYKSKQKANVSLNEKNVQLATLNEEKNKLIGVVAHDLRSPLNAVKGLVNITRIEKDESEKERFMALITQSTDRMTDMVNRILDVSAIESKDINLKMEEVDVVDLINQLMINFEMSANKKNQHFEFQSNCKAALIKIDKNYFTQVLENLVSNAIKYSDPNTEIAINIDLSNKSLKLSVIDNGQGISENDQKELFKEFVTVSSKTTAGEKATGLGLSIVKKYVESMNGKILCESELGKGSKFILKFDLITT